MLINEFWPSFFCEGSFVDEPGAGRDDELGRITFSPRRGTMICSLSTRGDARFIAFTSADRVGPPAAATASITRALGDNTYTPGFSTAPAT
jgi:hypothetical protein